MTIGRRFSSGYTDRAAVLAAGSAAADLGSDRQTKERFTIEVKPALQAVAAADLSSAR